MSALLAVLSLLGSLALLLVPGGVLFVPFTLGLFLLSARRAREQDGRQHDPAARADRPRVAAGSSPRTPGAAPIRPMVVPKGGSHLPTDIGVLSFGSILGAALDDPDRVHRPE